MAKKRDKPEETVNLLRQTEVLHGQGLSMADALRQLGVSGLRLPGAGTAPLDPAPHPARP